MSIPKFNDFFMPVLKLGETSPVSMGTAVEELSDQFKLSEEDRREKIRSSKRTTVVYSRVAWAVTFMVQAGLLSRPHRGFFEITDEGKKVIAAGHKSIDVAFLKRYPGYVRFSSPNGLRGGEKQIDSDVEGNGGITPEEKIGAAYEEFSGDLKSQIIQSILERWKLKDWKFLERMSVELLVAMGYGDGSEDSGEVIGGRGDEGIDGLVKEDKLGLGYIYIQAKMYNFDRPVPSSVVREFSGSLHHKGASKGVLFTTSYFAPDAINFATSNNQQNIVLIDGDRLSDLMIEYNVGVKTDETIELKKVDEEYFEQ